MHNLASRLSARCCAQNVAASEPQVAKALHQQLVSFFSAHEAHAAVLAPLLPAQTEVDASDPYDLL